MYRYKLNGGISVLDRFPQIEIIGQNDGPKMPVFESYFGEKSFVKKNGKKRDGTPEYSEGDKARYCI